MTNWRLLPRHYRRLEHGAKTRETSVARAALAWLLAKPTVASVIVGARGVGQPIDSLGAMDVKLG
jgi:aryl-alcohol dehydrogenase-like predicted oxidoreductase